MNDARVFLRIASHRREFWRVDAPLLPRRGGCVRFVSVSLLFSVSCPLSFPSSSLSSSTFPDKETEEERNFSLSIIKICIAALTLRRFAHR